MKNYRKYLDAGGVLALTLWLGVSIFTPVAAQGPKGDPKADPKGKGPTVDTCGYPNGVTNTKGNVAFAESTVLVTGALQNGKIIAWYSDEHSLTLGIREKDVKSGKTVTPGATSAVSPFTPYSVSNPAVGFTDAAGNDLPAGRSDPNFLLPT